MSYSGEARRRGAFMRATSQVRISVRGKLNELRRAAGLLKPDIRGPQQERTTATLKDYKKWSDVRDRANERGTR